MTISKRNGNDLPPARDGWAGELDFHALAQTLPTLIFVTDPHGRCLYTNSRFQQFTGFDARHLLDDGWLSIIHPEDRLRAVETWGMSVVTAEAYEADYRFRAADGEYRWFFVRGVAVHEHGRIVRWVGNCSDIDDRKLAEDNTSAARRQAVSALSVSEARYQVAFQSMFNFVGLLALDGTVLDANRAALELGGLRKQAVLGRKFWDTGWWDVGEAAQDKLRRAVAAAASGEFVRYEAEVRVAGGRCTTIDFSIKPVRNHEGHIVELIPEGRDLSAAKLAERELRERETLFRSVFETAAVGMSRVDLHSQCWLEVNDTFCAMLGYERSELIGRSCAFLTHPDDADPTAYDRLCRGELATFTVERRYFHKAGHLVWMLLTVTLVRDAEARPSFVLAVIQDITERKQQQAELAAAKAQQDFLLELADRLRPLQDPIAVMSAAAEMLGVHLGVGRVGYCKVDDDQESGTVYRDWSDGQMPSLVGNHRLSDYGPNLVARMRAGKAVMIADVNQDPLTDAPEVTALFARCKVRSLLNVPLVKAGRLLAILFLHQGEPRAWTASELGLVREVCARTLAAAEQARAEAALATNEAKLQAIMNAIPQMVWSTQPDGFHDYYNQRWYEYTGVPAGSTHGDGWNGMFHPDDQGKAWACWQHSLATGEAYEIEYRLRHHSGAYRWVLGRALPLRDAARTIIRWMGTCTELQAIVETRGALADARDGLETMVAVRTEELQQSHALLVDEMRRREQAQAALLQAQKLEALGQLTSGVAHDFNNMLAAIQGSFSLLRKRVHDETGQRLLQGGMRASERAAALIRQLLAFARREELRPAVLEPAGVLGGVGELLRQAVGRKVELVIEPVPSGTWRVAADLHQLEVALMNLAVNARDAMPEGGSVTIAARNAGGEDEACCSGLPAQDYVLFQVCDTGVGMPPEVLARAMEPFFTTKAVGQGTGLGLAMVHGMAQQLGGKLHIYSTPGVGTTMAIALPRCEQLPSDTAADETVIDPDLHGGATLLVVDDDDQVRIVTASFLRDLRYTVIEASSATAAYALAHASGAVDLVISDVAMPNTDGVKLAGRLRADWPELPILFVTGHPGDADLAGETVLPKPLSFGDMALHVARRLGRKCATP